MKEYLSQNKVDFTDYDVSKDEVRLEEMFNISGSLGVPVLTIDGEVLKGFNRKKIEKLLAG
ncbi:MAG: NrdH-redoxin [Chloroflexi bacterium]|nr:NrdH-redoxin [Chloroflexota bacterium]MBT7080988.1 NrdH-redoxin [Chloroflexota bacterium]